MTIARSFAELEKVISYITYKDWTISIRLDNNRPYIQISFQGRNISRGIEVGPVVEQRCRKWMLSYYMTDTEIVKTVYKAVEAAVLHEMQEQFLFLDAPIYNPHIDVKELWSICYKTEHRT